MTQPFLAHDTSFGRMYSRSINLPPLFPSITTIIGMGSDTLHGWFGFMAASYMADNIDLLKKSADPNKLRKVVREATNAAQVYREAAAARGNRVHSYAEKVALLHLGKGTTKDIAEAKELLLINGESDFVNSFNKWWEDYQVKPLAAEVTVWNDTVGYAGTLDLVAEIGGKVCLVDYKTKGTDRHGNVKGLDNKIVMQLAAGYKAEQCLLEPETGVWVSWEYNKSKEMALLLGVAIGETEVRTMRANEKVLAAYWKQFCSLKKLWDAVKEVSEAEVPLVALPPL